MFEKDQKTSQDSGNNDVFLEEDHSETLSETQIGPSQFDVDEIPPENPKQESDIMDPNEVKWDGNDQENVRNASKLRKWSQCLILIAAALQLTANSSVWSVTQSSIVEHFHTSDEIGILGISLYVIGLGAGPMFTAPLSEFYGRRIVNLGSFGIYIIFQFMTCFGKNITTLLLGRLLSSLSGSVLLASIPGSFTDMFEHHELAIPMAVFTFGPFVGPGLGPLLGGFIVAKLGFRWVYYVFLLWSVAMGVLCFIFVPETFEPVLLKKKAQRLRKTTGNMELYAPIERQNMNIINAIVTNCTRPFEMLFFEPMLSLLCIYTGFCLAVVYLFFVAFPIVFEDVYDFRIQFVGLSFLGLTIGQGLAMVASLFTWLPLHQKLVKKNNGIVEPEFRLPQMCFGSVVLPLGLFMFAWTIYSQIPWIVVIIASGVFGVGCYYTFNGILSYTVEAYRTYAASSMAANVFVRCTIAGGFPLFGRQMLEKLDYHWAMTLLGFLATLMMPSSFLFWKYGKVLRGHSKYASS